MAIPNVTPVDSNNNSCIVKEEGEEGGSHHQVSDALSAKFAEDQSASSWTLQSFLIFIAVFTLGTLFLGVLGVSLSLPYIFKGGIRRSFQSKM